MTSDFDARCQRLLVELGLCDPDDRPEVTPLTGGVASDIARVRVGGQDYCVKFALEKLKVAADWHAPVHRNAAEYAWLKVVSETLPHAAPRLYGRSAREGGFAMEYLAGPDIYLWKSAMLSAAPDQGEAAAMGATLGQIHAASTAPGFDAAPFQNRADFHALRIEPYLLFTASRHPDLAAHLTALATGLDHAATVLVHGDVSPKNILFRDTGPIILDAECATMGDASFDVAFCLNHLILKALHVWPSRTRLLGDVQLFWNAYAPHITWEDADALEARVAALLPALMLARVDGKSPVEYLTQPEAALIRRITPALITDPTDRLADLSALLTDQFKGQ